MRKLKLYCVLAAFLSALLLNVMAPGVQAQAGSQTLKDIASLDKILARAGAGGNVAVGDMFFVTSQLQRYRDTLAARANGGVRPRLAMDSSATKWPNGVVPYSYSSNVTSYDKAQFETACREWEKYAHVRFVPSSGTGNRLQVQNSDGNNSYIGMIGEYPGISPGGAQPFNIYNWNYPFIICHELSHALGMIHEQSRTDRDTYVTVVYNNIEDGYADQFDIVPGALNTGAYDYDSTMHYGRDAFGKSNGNGGLLDTLVPNGSNYSIWINKIGQVDHLSTLDRSGMASVYGPPTPYEPLNATATPQSSSSILVSWQQNTTNTTGYLIQRSTDGTSFTQIATRAETTYTDTELMPGTKYYYRIYATNSYGNSPLPSNIVFATTTAVSTQTQLWQASDLAVGSDNLSRLLWTRPDKAFAQWTLSASNAITSTPLYGPISGISASAIGVGNDAKARILLNTTDGRGIAWTVANQTTGAITSTPAYGPINGFTCREVTVGSNNLTRLLWTRSDGAFAVWTLDSSGNFTSTPLFGPIAGWAASAVSVGGDGKTTILINNVDGRAAIWTVQNAANGSITSTPAYGPISGFGCYDLATGGDNKTRMLWRRTDGAFAVWTATASSAANNFISTPLYGPIAGWSGVKVGVGGDLKTRVLLTHTDGRAVVWTLDSAGNIASTPAFGPIVTVVPSSAASRNATPALAQSATSLFAPLVSPVALSSSLASVAASAITLTFTGQLDTAAATDAGRYAVTVDGTPTGVESATLKSGDTTVTLSLPQGALSAASPVTVRYNLLDARGRMLTGTAKLTAH